MPITWPLNLPGLISYYYYSFAYSVATILTSSHFLKILSTLPSQGTCTYFFYLVGFPPSIEIAHSLNFFRSLVKEHFCDKAFSDNLSKMQLMSHFLI